MARVKTFRINPEHGVPDREIRDFITSCEKELGPVSISTIYVPALGTADPRMTVIVTGLDEPIQTTLKG
ncbi:MAG: hypothetical protein JW395_1064 [Nitrospira sp.]|nr:hypothetical protein [Nitrospira sp.]